MNEPNPPSKLQVYYDGSCPLCTREIAFYERLEKGGDMEWVDISDPNETRLPDSLTHKQAMSRFHARDDQGRIYSGASAFSQLWVRLPAFQWLGRFSQMRPVGWILERSYRLFLAIRPYLSQFLKMRQNAISNKTGTV